MNTIKIKIKRKEAGLMRYVGHFEDGRQFMALEVYFHALPILSDWQNRRKEYVVIHIFDKEGLHLESRQKYLGTTAELNGRDTDGDIEELFKGMGRGQYADIQIQPFLIAIEGNEYGLIQDNENLCFNLMPNDISFSDPWEGDYDA